MTLQWAALCPMVPPCRWRDDGYTDEQVALVASRLHGREDHPGRLHLWASREIGVATHYPAVA